MLSKRHAAAALAAIATLGVTVTGGGSTARLETTTPVQVVSQQVLSEINFARTSPSAYADLLANLPKTPTRDEAIDYVRGRMPAGPLAYDPRLGMAAYDHAQDQGPIGGTSHTGSDGSSPMQRLQRGKVYAQIVAEEISVAQNTPRSIIRVLVMDEGVAGRLHRRDIFDPLLTIGGVGCAAHKTYRIICVIDMTGPPMERSAPPPR